MNRGRRRAALPFGMRGQAGPTPAARAGAQRPIRRRSGRIPRVANPSRGEPGPTPVATGLNGSRNLRLRLPTNPWPANPGPSSRNRSPAPDRPSAERPGPSPASLGIGRSVPGAIRGPGRAGRIGRRAGPKTRRRRPLPAPQAVATQVVVPSGSRRRPRLASNPGEPRRRPARGVSHAARRRIAARRPRSSPLCFRRWRNARRRARSPEVRPGTSPIRRRRAVLSSSRSDAASTIRSAARSSAGRPAACDH